jgi:hypothetical protein
MRADCLQALLLPQRCVMLLLMMMMMMIDDDDDVDAADVAAAMVFNYVLTLACGCCEIKRANR